MKLPMYRVVFALATSAAALSPVVAQEPAPGQINDKKHAFEKEVNISMPASESEHKAIQDADQIVINVTADGKIVIQKQELTEEQLSQKLSTVASVNLKQAIVIRGDKNSGYEHIFRVLENCRKAGLYHVSFASSKAPTNKPASP